MEEQAPEKDWLGELQSHLSLRDISQVAERLVRQQRYDEAIALFEAALRVYPESLALRLNLARVRDLKRRAQQHYDSRIRQEWDRQRVESDLIAHHFVSLARVYMKTRRMLKALEMLELARHLNPQLAEIYRLEGKIYYEQMSYDKARQALERARELDPFNAETAYLASKVYLELQDREKALAAMMDAYVLSAQEGGQIREFYGRHVRMLAESLGYTHDDVRKMFELGKAYYNQMVEQLILKRDQLTFEMGPPELEWLVFQWPKIQRNRQSVISTAIELRKLMPFQIMTDEQVFLLAKQSRWLTLEPERVIYTEGQPLKDMHIVLEGQIRLIRETPFGRLQLAEFDHGEVVGIPEFIDHQAAIATAVTPQTCRAIAIPHTAVEELMVRDRYLSVQMYWHFWKSLAQYIRRANDRAEAFFRYLFRDETRSADKPKRPLAVAEHAQVEPDEKIALLKERGLSSSELQLLATFSQEEQFRQGQAIFREGDPGDRLYIILDGQVRISRFIPGVGEEALAILERGEFFGEMSLVDRSPRSADAIAHSPTVTVLAIDQRILTDILSRDPESATRFLEILCRILSRRLRDIYEKIYQWHMMAGVSVPHIEWTQNEEYE